MKTILAIDYGIKKLGIAIGEVETKNCFPLETIGTNEKSKLDSIVKEWRPSLIVVGHPKNLDNTNNKMTTKVEDFIKILQADYDIPYELVDERYSSFEARELLKDLPQKSKKKIKNSKNRLEYDHISAIIIMNMWFEKNE